MDGSIEQPSEHIPEPGGKSHLCKITEMVAPTINNEAEGNQMRSNALRSNVAQSDELTNELRTEASQPHTAVKSVPPSAKSVPPPSSWRLRVAPSLIQGGPTQVRRFVSAIDASIDGLAILEGESFVYMNAQHARMYGYSPEELLGKSWRELYDSEEQARLEQCALSDVLEKGHYRGEAKGLRKDGTLFEVEISLTKTHYGDLVCSCRDISARKQIEAEQAHSRKLLSLLNSELQKSSRMKDEILAVLSHELRTPLNTILGMAELLQESAGKVLAAEQLEWVSAISGRGEHLLSLINDLLDLSKIVVGKMEVRPDLVNIADICKASVRAVQGIADKKNIYLELFIEEGVSTVYGEGKRIRQILMHLLGNALKFTPSGGSVGILVSAGRSENMVSITVWDTGIGIAPSQMQTLFEPFVQGSGGLSRQFEGTGLGLALVARLAELHRGSVHVESDFGRGSRFTVHLPAVEDSSLLGESL